MKIKTFPIVIVFLLISPNIISSASASTVSNNEENVNLLNLINSEDSTAACNEKVETSPLMMFGGDKKFEEKKKNLSTDDQTAQARRHAELLKQQDSEEKLDEEAIEIDDAFPLTLDQFKQAVDDYPEATRLIIIEEEEDISIQPQAADPKTSDKNDAENQKIMRMLKDLITTYYSSAVANDIPELSQMAFVSAKALGAAKISEILSKIEITATTKRQRGETPSLFLPSSKPSPFSWQEEERFYEAMRRLAMPSEQESAALYQEADHLWSRPMPLAINGAYKHQLRIKALSGLSRLKLM